MEGKKYFTKSIKKKANDNKFLLGKLYNNLLDMSDKLDIDELRELNDLDLLLDYLDYVDSIRQKKISTKLLNCADSGHDFLLIDTGTKQITFNMDITESDREEAKEEAFFTMCSNAGAFVFEDYDDGLTEIEDITSSLIASGSDVFAENFEDMSVENKGSINCDSGDIGDTMEDTLDSLLIDIETTDEDFDSFESLESLLDDINSKSDEVEDEVEVKGESDTSGYDFFNDFTDDTDEPDDDFNAINEFDIGEEEITELPGYLDDTNAIMLGENADIPDNSSDEDVGSEDDDKEFEEFCSNKLEEKWGMFTSHIPGWSLEDYEGTPLTGLVALINRGKIELPEDKTLLSDELIEFFLQQKILAERPVKKVEEDEIRDTGAEDDSLGDIQTSFNDDIERLNSLNPKFDFSDMNSSSNLEQSMEVGVAQPIIESEVDKQLFKSRSASDRVNAANEWRKKIGLFGKKKLIQKNDDIDMDVDSDNMFNDTESIKTVSEDDITVGVEEDENDIGMAISFDINTELEDSNLTIGTMGFIVDDTNENMDDISMDLDFDINTEFDGSTLNDGIVDIGEDIDITETTEDFSDIFSDLTDLF